MKKKVFSSGRAWSTDGRPSSYWTGSVQYAWNAKKKMFSVCVEQTLGTGSVFNSHQYEIEINSCQELNELLHAMQETEVHYRKEYE